MKNLVHLLFLTPSFFFSLSPDKALEKIKEGNRRFVDDKSPQCSSSQNDRRKVLQNMQEPFAIILGCSDSRVPPEILFDQGIGDLFIIRVAGNVLGQSELDSMTFAVKALGSSLIVVLGHENCGAIKAVWKKQADIIPFINKKILPAIDFKDPKCTLACQTKNNIKYIVDQIKKSETFFSEINNNTLKVIGAYYPFISGKVEFLD
jgi:carbonic anhydrase